MKNGQVTIYAPNQPDTPWEKGETDEQGHFTFTPDSNLKGEWTIKVRQAGHGAILSIPLGKNDVSLSGNTGFSVLQIILMLACVLWGLIGTALYFKGRQKHAHS